MAVFPRHFIDRSPDDDQKLHYKQSTQQGEVPMNRPYLLAFLIGVLSSPLWSLAPVPVSSWYSLGLDNEAIHSVIADDTTLILAGSDSGVSVRYGGKWFRAAGVRMAVRAMVRVSSERIVAAMGDGSKSDGLYIGTKIRGEPYYQFAIVCYITDPQALAVSGGTDDTVYAGTKDALYRCVLPKVSEKPLIVPETIKIPQFAFGCEMPTCKALLSVGGQLFAGGYDRSPNPCHANLLYNVKDSMMIVRPMNVTAMTATNFSSGVTPASALAIGTIDSGIYIGNNIILPADPAPTKPWTRYDSPNKEPVNDIISIPTVNITPRQYTDALIVAVKSGAFGGSNGVWTEVGALPVVPLCLAEYGNITSSYLAGTDKGVYRYGPLSTGLQETGGKALHAAVTLGKGNHVLVVALTEADRITISMYDLAGRLVGESFAKNLNAGRNSVLLPFNNSNQCPYIVSVTGSNGMAVNQLMTIGK
jgi:hypothetical protein